MKDIVIKNHRDTDITYEELYELFVESYRQWIEKGLDAPWLHKTLEEYKAAKRHSAAFVALDRETGELLGVHFFKPNSKKKCVFGYGLAVSPKAKVKGIASQMLTYESERIRQAGYYYLLGISSIEADWSVRWHLKNGYRIIGYRRSPNNKYADYTFRKQLIPISFSSPASIAFILHHPVYALHSSSAFCCLRYILSYAVMHIVKDSKGNDTAIGRFFNRLHRGRK